jgi:phospholipid/cholesterol/gamma-HCH transport system ATP-binding protein
MDRATEPMPSPAASEPIIAVEHLVTHWGERLILDDIDFSVMPREIMVVIGGSGSGKTTLLRHLLGLHKPTSGRIFLFGKDINRLDSVGQHELRSRIGMSFQGGALFNSLSVGDNVALPLREHTALDEHTIRIMVRMKLELVQLGGFEDLMPAQLSGGMLKRAALARAIVLDPPLLFFDEPSAGLDPVVAAELDNLILKLRESLGMTIVVVTHELESAFKIADRITVLDQGRILFSGSVEALKGSESRRVQDLLHRRAAVEALDPDEYLDRLTRMID